MPGRPPILSVPEAEADQLLQEVLIRAEARKKATPTRFDPALGASRDEAEAKLALMRDDIGAYGEYVFDLKPARVHQFWNDAVDDVIRRRIRQNKVLIIAPPNSAKSTWNSIIRSSHYLGQHPDHNLILLTSSDPMSMTFLSSVRSALADNERHRAAFPDQAARPHRARGWSSDVGLYLQGTPPGSKDPAFKAGGMSASIMGARAHGIILDDPLDQKSAISDAEQRRAKQYYDQTIVPRLQPDTGWLLCVMTRFHEADLASHFIQLAEQSGDWLVIRTPQIADGDDDPIGRRPGELLWPERLTPTYVANEQSRMGIAEFNLVHQGDPTGMGGDLFKSEQWFQPLPADFWSKIEPTCRMIQAWDLAFSERDRACFTVGVTVAIDAALNCYVVHVVRKRMTIVDTENTIVELAKIARPIVVGIEHSKFHQKATLGLVRAVLDRVMVNIQLVRPDSDKYARAQLPAGRAEAGKVFVNKATPWARAFIGEHLGFPATRYKDQVDAFSLAVYLAQQIGEAARANAAEPVQVEYAMGAA